MKIDKDKLHEPGQGVSRPSSTEPKAAATELKTAGAETKTAGEKTADKVDLSSLKEEVARLKAKAKEAPDIDEEKVARIKKALESGTYHVDATAVARSILKDHLADEID